MYNIYKKQKRGDQMPEKRKRGRPTDNPKTTQFTIRFDKETLDILDNYCKKQDITRPEAVRTIIRQLQKKK